MQYRHVGRSGLRVSEIGIGGWITLGGTVDEQDAIRILRTAVDEGVNFIDLADIYAHGDAERVAGEALHEIQRSDLVISSKVFWPMSDNANDRGLSRKHIIESCEKSLKRLQTDYLDIYFCHRFDEETPLEETVRAMEDLIRAGKVLYWGTSVWTPDQLRAVHDVCGSLGAYSPIVEQPRYNLFDRRIEKDGTAQICQDLGMGLVVWSPLGQGMLTGKYDHGVPEGSRADVTSWLDSRLTAENLTASRAFSEFAREAGHEPAHLALAWVLDHPHVSSVITGASRAEQLRSNVAACDISLDDATRQRISAIFANASW